MGRKLFVVVQPAAGPRCGGVPDGAAIQGGGTFLERLFFFVGSAADSGRHWVKGLMAPVN
jgi:hypothetical protein